MKFFDAHTHPHFAAFKDDSREVIRRAVDYGVGMILVGTQKDTSRRSVEVAHEFEHDPVYAAVGLHPVHTEKSYHDPQELGLPQIDADETRIDADNTICIHPRISAPTGFTSRSEEFDYAYYKKLAEDPKTVAIGECGLDYYRLATSDPTSPQLRRAGKEQATRGEDEIAKMKEKQKNAFMQQIELSLKVKKPLMIHCRNAFADLIEILKPNTQNLQPGVVHFFTGTLGDARKLADIGFSFTFGGVITFARDYDEVIKYLPLDRILSETDAPYVAPVPYRGKRNEPLYVIEVVKKLAEIKGVSVETMQNQICENAKRVFGL